MNHVILTQIPA